MTSPITIVATAIAPAYRRGPIKVTPLRDHPDGVSVSRGISRPISFSGSTQGKTVAEAAESIV